MDDASRDLERRASLGDSNAEVAHLLARVRAGEITRAQLELAARLRHPVACAAVGRIPLPIFDPQVPEFVEELHRDYGRYTCTQLIYHLASSALPAIQAQVEASLLLEALEDVEGWLRAPDDNRRRALEAYGWRVLTVRSHPPSPADLSLPLQPQTWVPQLIPSLRGRDASPVLQ